MPERIELLTGAARWLSALQGLVALAAACVLLTAPAPWAWRLGALVALSLFTLIAAGLPPGWQARGKLVLNLDGRVRVTDADGETEGLVNGGAWVSPWFCVLHWMALEGGARRHSLLCASLNRADDYRRFLCWARLGAFSGRESLSP